MNSNPEKITDLQWSTRSDQELAYRQLVRTVQEVIFTDLADGVHRNGEAFYGVIHGIIDGALNDSTLRPESLFACYYYGTSKNRAALREALLPGLRQYRRQEGRLKDTGGKLPQALLTDESALQKELDRYFYVYHGTNGYHAFRRVTPKPRTE
ncbi:hypothetical protein [Arthrobacter woluwensis]|uniref:hypothetical protein n=1 Tax=Arthrobacter woluwensis TaxID=156980 RepID=UPI00119E7858|nr:hypothetical protein [Arthrobacter woluwensis]